MILLECRLTQPLRPRDSHVPVLNIFRELIFAWTLVVLVLRLGFLMAQPTTPEDITLVDSLLFILGCVVTCQFMSMRNRG